MKKPYFILIILFFAFVSEAQEKPIVIDTTDVIYKEALLEEIYISNEKLSPEEIEGRKQFLLLKRRVYRTYPYAKTASERLEILNKNLAKLKTKKEKKRFLKITEDYMENEFEARLKNLSRKDGQVLVKLINRQTGQTTYDLVKDLKSGWSAYWYGKAAKIYNIDLKVKYNPYSVKEDFLIEDILLDGFANRLLVEQPPKQKLDYVKIANIWREKENIKD